MTSRYFNEKYKECIEPGFNNPLQIDIPEVVIFLDGLFKDLSRIPKFRVSQIKLKFDSCRFYSNLGNATNLLVEQGINEILKKLKETK